MCNNSLVIIGRGFDNLDLAVIIVTYVKMMERHEKIIPVKYLTIYDEDKTVLKRNLIMHPSISGPLPRKFFWGHSFAILLQGFIKKSHITTIYGCFILSLKLSKS